MSTLALAFLLMNLWGVGGGEGDSCRATADCASDMICRDQTCVYRGAGESCERSADCATPLRCRAKVCMSEREIETAAPGARPPPPPPRDRRPPPPLPMRAIPYHEGDPVPEGMVVVERSNSKLWAAGLALFLPTYLLSGTATSIACLGGCVPSAVPVSWIPVFGNFINLRVSSPGFAAFLIATGVVQIASAAMFIVGLVVTERYLIIQAGPIMTSLVPTFSPLERTFSWEGRF